MITRIEIDGFKTFKDFSVDLAPFQVIVGPNGSGKSNLFDALQLLSRLAELDLRSAFQEVRGDANELFTKGVRENRIKFAVEMLVDHRVRDRLGREVELKDTRLRYELEITRFESDDSLPELRITHEALRTIAVEQDYWIKKYGVHSQSEKSRNLISAVRKPSRATRNVNEPESSMALTIRLHGDGAGKSRNIIAENAEATVLSSITNTDYSHAFAAREGLRSLRFLHLNPEALRQPASVQSERSLSPEGKNLPTTLIRMQTEDEYALIDVSRDMANLVRGIIKIRVERDKASDKYVIYAETSDQQTFSAQVLSDGTLRLLALATLRNDPQLHGTLCLEEPEDSVEPLHLKVMARVLREIATDFTNPNYTEEPLRQVLITSHSPSFISLSEVFDSLVFTHLVTLGTLSPKDSPIRVTRMEPIVTSNTQSRQQTEGEQPAEIYTIDIVRQYLSSEDLNRARNQLKKARIHSIESNAS